MDTSSQFSRILSSIAKRDLCVHNVVELDRGAIVMANNRIWEYIIVFALFRESQNMLFKVHVSVKPRLKKSWQ